MPSRLSKCAESWSVPIFQTNTPSPTEHAFFQLSVSTETENSDLPTLPLHCNPCPLLRTTIFQSPDTQYSVFGDYRFRTFVVTAICISLYISTRLLSIFKNVLCLQPPGLFLVLLDVLCPCISLGYCTPFFRGFGLNLNGVALHCQHLQKRLQC